ncbi:MAG: AAA family ATPase [Kiloniellales bacterium]|nr:AAA family ATPase [Kiloniellales bacterium]
MALDALRISGYRSLKELRVPLSGLNVFTGPNGCGKSNLYRALLLIAAAARGELAKALGEEGGMPSALWAGERGKGSVRMRLGFASENWDYEIGCGLPNIGRTYSAFILDPLVKAEEVRYIGGSRPVALLERKNASVWLRGEDGRRVSYPLSVIPSESALSQIVDPQLYPELAALRQDIGDWRFYHHFRTDADTPLRRPQTGVLTPVLANDGVDLAAALQTVLERGDRSGLEEAIDDAFPGSELVIFQERGRFEVGLTMPGIQRPFEARELSDGTLRYLCLLAALMSPWPPGLLALNEPETSIHADLLAPLAQIVLRAAETTQILLVTHSGSLADHLEAGGAAVFRLEKVEGETVLAG